MTVPSLSFADMEAWAVGWLTPKLAPGTWVARTFPPTNSAVALAVVVRDDSGADDGWLLGQRRLGFTVLAHDYQTAGDAARLVAAWLRASPADLSTPVVKVTIRGPYSVSTDPRTEFYLTADLTVVGQPVTL